MCILLVLFDNQELYHHHHHHIRQEDSKQDILTYRQEVIGDWTKLHKGDIHTMSLLLNVIVLLAQGEGAGRGRILVR
jgi:hypothetical protein